MESLVYQCDHKGKRQMTPLPQPPMVSDYLGENSCKEDSYSQS